jgi:hypothetical protein
MRTIDKTYDLQFMLLHDKQKLAAKAAQAEPSH